jgi:DNA-directed RNA polymerase specialized sigma24 family protein
MEQEQFKKEILPLREKLFLYARRLLDNPEDAEDIMQEVFLKLWYMRGELDYYNNVMALSVQITKHLCLNRMKVRERTEGEAANNSLSAMPPRLIPSWNKKTVWSM